MANTTVRDVKPLTEYDVELARKELIAQLAEAEKCTNDECEDFEVFFKRLMDKYNGKV